MSLGYLVVNNPEQFNLEFDDVTIVSDREYLIGPSELSVLTGCFTPFGIDTFGGWQGALVTSVISSLTIGKIDFPSDFTVTAFDT